MYKRQVLEARKNSSFTKNFERKKQDIINPFGNTTVGGLKQGDEGFDEALLNARKMVQSVDISQPPSKNQNVVELPPINLPPEDNTVDDNLNDAPNASNGEISSEDGGIPFVSLVEGNANTNMNLYNF